jgi:hypothetical protein
LKYLKLLCGFILLATNSIKCGAVSVKKALPRKIHNPIIATAEALMPHNDKIAPVINERNPVANNNNPIVTDRHMRRFEIGVVSAL